MPPLPRISRGPADFGRRATAQDFGGQVAAERAQTGQLVGQIGGAVAEQGDRILQASRQAKLARAAAEYQAADDQLRFDLETDTDLDTQEERYEKSREDLLQKTRQALPAALHGQFDDRVFAARAHGMLELRGQIRRKRLDGARADTQAMLDLQSNAAAQAQDPVRRAQIRGQVHGQLAEQLEAGVIDQAQYDKAVREFDRGVSLSDVRRLMREDPEEAFRRLGTKGDPITQGFDQAEIEQMRSQSRDEIDQRLRQNREDERFRQQQQEKAERDASEKAQKDIEDQYAAGNLSAAQATLKRARAVMSASEYAHYSELIAGKGKVAKTVPDIYIDLDTRAARGEPIADAANDAYLRGQLDQDDRDRVIKKSSDRRFGSVTQFVDEATRPGFVENIDDAAKAQLAAIRREVDDWMQKHPDATEQEAKDAAARTLDAYAKREAAKLLTVQDQGGAAGIQAASDAALARHEAGEITDAQLDAELRRLEALESLQKLLLSPGGKK